MLSQNRKFSIGLRFFSSQALNSSRFQVKNIQLPNGETYAYREAGNGPKVLLMTHAALATSYFYQFLFPELSKHFKIIAPDLRGCGHSTYHKPVQSIEDYADDLKIFINALNLSQINFFGWSMGGTIGLKFAAKYPETLESLILASTASFKGCPLYKTSNDGYVKIPILKRSECYVHPFVNEIHNRMIERRKDELREKFFKYCYHGLRKPDHDRMEDYLEEAMMTKNAREYLANRAFFNFSSEHNGVIQGTGEVYKIKTKTLIIHGTNDKACDPAIAKELQDCIGRNAELILLSGAGHCVFEDFPEETVRAVTNFCFRKQVFIRDNLSIHSA